MQNTRLCAVLVLLAACGGDKTEAKAPEATMATATPAIAEVAPPATTASIAPPVEAPVAPPPARTDSVAEAKVVLFERSKDSGKLDKIGVADGDLKPDGKKDLVFNLKVQGPVDAIFLATVDKKGDSAGTFQADSLTGTDTQPNELAVAKAGKLTEGLAVFKGDVLLNAANGSLAGKIPAGEHALTVHIATSAAIKVPLRIWLQMPDHTMVAGPILSK
jgi:hypothetical protein